MKNETKRGFQTLVIFLILLIITFSIYGFVNTYMVIMSELYPNECFEPEPLLVIQKSLYNVYVCGASDMRNELNLFVLQNYPSNWNEENRQ